MSSSQQFNIFFSQRKGIIYQIRDKKGNERERKRKNDEEYTFKNENMRGHVFL